MNAAAVNATGLTTMTLHDPLAMPRALGARRWLPAVALAALLAAGCASTRNDEALVQARQALRTAESTPHVTRLAAPELGRAQEALRRAESAALSERSRDEVAHRAYVARQLAAAATAQADSRQAEDRLQQARSERDQIILSARERETIQAQQQAAQATRQAQQAQQQVDVVQQQAQAAERDAALRAQQQGQAAERDAAMRAQQAQEQLAAAQMRTREETQRAEQLQNQLKEFEAKQTERGTVMTLGGDVLFDTGKASMRGGARRSVQRLAGVLRQHPDRKVAIEGFTDSVGGEDYNLELSRRRAEAVKEALVQEGVPADRVETKSYGEAYPVADNESATGRQMNRRVEIVISNEQGQIGAR